MADLNTDNTYPVVLSPLNARGEPAPVDGVPVWASSDETVVTVAPSEDGMSAVINTVAAGVARVTVTADADLGEGVSEITGVTDDLNVTVGPNSEASVLTLTIGDPQPKA